MKCCSRYGKYESELSEYFQMHQLQLDFALQVPFPFCGSILTIRIRTKCLFISSEFLHVEIKVQMHKNYF